jgi:two-component system phosphate regulon sensor histidine kinase PhoR
MTGFGRKFSLKLVLTFCAVVGLTLAFADFLILRGLHERLIENLRQQLLTQTRQLCLVIPPEAFQKPVPRWEDLTGEIIRTTGVRATLISAQGVVTADSDVAENELPQVQNHLNRPEIQQAIRSGSGSDIRHSQTVGEDFLYAAVPASGGFVRLAMPLAGIRQTLSQYTAAVVGSTLGAVGLGVAMILLLSRWVTRPLTDMTQAAKSIAEGELGRRVSVDSRDEIGDLAKAFNLMVGRLESALGEAQDEKEHLSAILSSMMEQVLAVDGSGKVVLLNPSAERLFGVQRAEAVGKPFLEVIRQAAISDLCRQVLADGRERSEELRLFLPDERFFELRALPIQLSGQERGALVVLHDVTRIMRLENLRKEFVANVSHELRTPLTSIQGFAETLLSGALSDSKNNREFVETIDQQAGRLTRLVDDLLDLSAIESGRKKPQAADIPLAALAKEVAAQLQPQAQKRSVAIVLEIPESFSVKADRDQLRQVLINLFDNAIKFNRPQGSVTVSARQEGSSATISVRDTGMGIPEADLPRIFERFYRVDKARSRELGGTGLGLAIVKHIVEAHGGSVRAESAPQQGTVFHIVLPA